MKIAYISSIFFTDCDFPLIKSFQKLGHQIIYIIRCSSTTGGLFNIKTKLLKNHLYEGRSIPEVMIYDKYMNMSGVYVMTKSKGLLDPSIYLNFHKVNNLISNFKPDVIHITGAQGLSELQTYRFFRKMVMTVHDPFTHSGETNLNNEWKRMLSFHLCRRLILLNNKQKQEFENHYHIKDSKVFINKLGVYDCLNYLACRGKYDEGLPERYVLFFGHFSPYKGIDILCEAMKVVHKTHPEVKCIIAGKGQLNFDFAPYKDLGYIILKNEFIETDYLALLINQSLFTVCPYKDATQSGVVSSSFAINKPVVATRVGGLPETVIDGIKGCIAEPNDVSSLAGKINVLLDNPELLEKMGNNIKSDNEKEENSWNFIAQKYVEIYKTL